MPTLTRLLTTLFAAALVASGCTSTPAEPTVDPSTQSERAARLDALREDVAELAAVQDAADTALLGVLEVVRSLDQAVVAVRSVETMDDSLEGQEARNAQFLATSVAGLRTGFLDTAEAVDDARETLAQATAILDDPWERSYLAAEESVLTAVRSYAQTADELAQLLVQHWPLYREVNDALTSFAERRWFFRTDEEAANALIVEYDSLFARLPIPQAQIAQWRDSRSAAATEVNEATDAALAAWDARPSDQPTQEPSAPTDPASDGQG